MNVRNRVVACLFLVAAIAAKGAEPYGAAVIDGRIPGLWQTNGVVFYQGRPYRGVGANYFELFLRVLHEPTNHTSLEGLDQLGRAGIPFVRFAVAYDNADWRLFLDNRNEFFRRLDVVVQEAERAKVGLIPSFFWRFESFPELSKEPREQWGNPHSKTCALMRQIVGAIVERYKLSPGLWAWEFGNEPNLQVDLPNAAQFRKPGGTEHDDLTSVIMVSMLREFAREVRRHDPHRLLIAGHSHPRASAWHNTAEKSWRPDSQDQTLEILRRDNPPPLDTIAIHLYADHPVTQEVAAWAKDNREYLRAVRTLSQEMKRPVIVGEFGLASQGQNEAETRAKFEELLTAMEQAQVDLAAFWVFDLPSQSPQWSVTFDNPRSYMIRLAAEVNRRWHQAALQRQD
ncbi:MAG TPA: cellulase family glycosylhydrolase [Verrucomicrobiae bacterium]|nr:cellulase family glycosylhydrolase [Verrucomicrobiae bacterium]